MANRTNIQSTTNLTFRSYSPFTDFEIIKDIWITLQNKCSHSYFTSWGWISAWINSLPTSLDVQLIVGHLKGEPAIAFFIGTSNRKNHKFIPVKTISLNSTANQYFDKLTIEYNSILFNPAFPINIEDVFRYLKSLDWNDFILPGTSSDFISTFHLLDNTSRSFYLIVDRVKNSFLVELQKIRDVEMDYLQLLSPKKRSQIRRSIKQYKTEGEIQIHQAANVQEALSMLDKLAVLHQETWQNRGEEGSFSNKYFYQFHIDLIQNRFSNNEIQLLHIFNEKSTIGYLYNFTYEGRVLFYQSGYSYSAGKNYRPGDVSHYFAILYNAKLMDMIVYDFLAGDQQYKRTLATNTEPMYWLRFIKNRTRFNFEKSIIKIKQILKIPN